MKSFDRRHFLKQSTLVTAGIGASLRAKANPVGSTRQLSRRPAPSDRIRIACVGCGGMGRGDLAAFLRNDDVDCVAVCDVDEAQLAKATELVNQARGYLPSTYTDFRRIFDRDDVDALLVATPDHWHALPTVYACQCGLDVYVEKPLGKSISEGAAMVEAARRSGSVVQMGTQWRSAEHFRDAVSFVQSGKIGKVRLVRTWAYLDWVGGIGNPPDTEPPEGVDYDMWLGPAPKRPFNPNRFHFNFRWFWDYAGGLMTDWGVHLLNICLWAMGYSMPLRVMCSGGKRIADDNTETPDTQVAVYEFPEYTLIFEQEMLGGLGPGGKPNGMLFNGSEGTVIIDTQGWEIVPEPKKNNLEPARYEAVSDGRPAHIRNFLDCIKTREQPVENLEIAHVVSTVAHLGNLAFRSQSQIEWDAKRQSVAGNAYARTLAFCEYRKPWRLPYVR